MFLVVAVNQGLVSSLPYSATEQLFRSWEGAQPGSQPKLASGNIPNHSHHAQFMNGGWLGGSRLLAFQFSASVNPAFSGNSAFFRNFMKFAKIRGAMISAWGLAANRSSGGEKIILYIFCFAYSLLLLSLVVVVVLVFPLLPY